MLGAKELKAIDCALDPHPSAKSQHAQILQIIRGYSNRKTGRTNPSLDTIARHMRFADRSALRPYMADLHDWGLLLWERGGLAKGKKKVNNVYHIPFLESDSGESVTTDSGEWDLSDSGEWTATDSGESESPRSFIEAKTLKQTPTAPSALGGVSRSQNLKNGEEEKAKRVVAEASIPDSPEEKKNNARTPLTKEYKLEVMQPAYEKFCEQNLRSAFPMTHREEKAALQCFDEACRIAADARGPSCNIDDVLKVIDIAIAGFSQQTFRDSRQWYQFCAIETFRQSYDDGKLCEGEW